MRVYIIQDTKTKNYLTENYTTNGGLTSPEKDWTQNIMRNKPEDLQAVKFPRYPGQVLEGLHLLNCVVLSIEIQTTMDKPVKEKSEKPVAKKKVNEVYQSEKAKRKLKGNSK